MSELTRPEDTSTKLFENFKKKNNNNFSFIQNGKNKRMKKDVQNKNEINSIIDNSENQSNISTREQNLFTQKFLYLQHNNVYNKLIENKIKIIQKAFRKNKIKKIINCNNLCPKDSGLNKQNENGSNNSSLENILSSNND